MFESVRLPAGVRDLAMALEGASPARAETATLLGLAAAIAGGASVPMPVRMAAARSALHRAVVAEAARRRANPGPAARVRGAAVGAAAAAGAGLLVASAASGSDPVTVVRQAVNSIPYASDASLPSPAAVSFDGVVTGQSESGDLLVSASGDVVQVRISPATAIRDSNGQVLGRESIAEGAAVRVTGARRGGVVLASEITAIRITAAAPPATTDPAPATTRTAAEVRPAASSGSAATPMPSASPRSSIAVAKPPEPASTARTATPVASTTTPATGGVPSVVATSPPTAKTAVPPTARTSTPTPPSPTPTPVQPVTSSVRSAQAAPKPSRNTPLTP